MENKPFEFHWAYDGYEVRSTMTRNDEPTVELVHWEQHNGRDCCYTIAYWHKDREGWDLCFVGDRMLELSQLHIEKIWPQLCASQIMLEAWYKDQDCEL